MKLLFILLFFISCEKKDASNAVEKSTKTNTPEINSFLGDTRENESDSLIYDELILFGAFRTECIIEGDESIKIDMYMPNNVLEITGTFFQNNSCLEDGSESFITNVYDISDFSFISSTKHDDNLIVKWENIALNFNSIDNGYKINGIEFNKI